MKSVHQPDPRRGGEGGEGEEERKVSLCSIITDFLAGQHSLCRNPMSTCPEFDLFLPHKCPDQRAKRAAPLNITSRLASRGLGISHGGRDRARLDRKLLYSRFRPVKTFRSEEVRDEDRIEGPNLFTSCAFSGDGQFLLAGTYMGEVKTFNLHTSDEVTYACHDSHVYHVQPSRDNRLFITSSLWRTPYSKLWSLGENFEEKFQYKDEEYLEFSRHQQDKVIGTLGEGTASIYDLTSGQQVRLLKPTTSNSYTRNRATFDPTDELILSDGVLWDYRARRHIHKFDKLNQTLSGVFHPNGMEIISNTEVWDVRTFRLLRNVPQLDQCQVIFNTSGDVMFGAPIEQELDDETKFETAFKTFEASDYSLIATVDVRKSVLGLCCSKDDLSVAVVEQATSEVEESVVRLYDVGRLRAEEEDREQEEEEDADDGDDGEEEESESEGGENGEGEAGSESDDDWGLPIALFPDGEDLSGSGSGTPSEDDQDSAEVVEVAEEGSGGSWEDVEDEET